LIQTLAGFFILLSFLTTLYAYFIEPSIVIISGLFAWIALLCLFQKVSQKKLIYILLGGTGILLCFSYFKGFEIDVSKALLVNQHLLVLLIGVGFLRLIATPKKNKVKTLPQGENAFLKTYLGVHLFGSVINLSSLILVADKLYKKAPLSSLQLVLLTRSFSSDAYWSPFFVAFAAAITYAPNLSASYILLNGILLAFIAFCITYYEVKKNYNIQVFRGYPIHFETLYIPVLLALMVLIVHHYFPHVKVIILIALFSLFLTIAILLMKSGLKKSVGQLFTYVHVELPNMKNELALFLIAGAFGVSISSVLLGYGVHLPFESFDALSASILLFVFIALSFVGIHPIISIAVIGNWMNEFNHTLLAMSFLMSWATAVSTSPFSGLNLTIQSRYEIKAMDIFKTNIGYALKMYVIGVISLFLAQYILKIS
jgi:hypothetical protein